MNRRGFLGALFAVAALVVAREPLADKQWAPDVEILSWEAVRFVGVKQLVVHGIDGRSSWSSQTFNVVSVDTRRGVIVARAVPREAA